CGSMPHSRGPALAPGLSAPVARVPGRHAECFRTPASSPPLSERDCLVLASHPPGVWVGRAPRSDTLRPTHCRMLFSGGLRWGSKDEPTIMHLMTRQRNHRCSTFLVMLAGALYIGIAGPVRGDTLPPEVGRSVARWWHAEGQSG